jgi:hypothetical protein
VLTVWQVGRLIDGQRNRATAVAGRQSPGRVVGQSEICRLLTPGFRSIEAF